MICYDVDVDSGDEDGDDGGGGGNNDDAGGNDGDHGVNNAWCWYLHTRIVVKLLRSRPNVVIKHPDLTSAIHDTIQADISAWMCITLVTRKCLC